MVFWTYENDLFQVGVWKLEETLDELCLLSSRGESLREESIGRFKSIHRQMEWVAVRVLAEQMMGHFPTINYLPTGKPVVWNGHISISHTKGYVALVWSKDNEVGIDIERVSPRIDQLKSRIVSQQEKADTTLDVLLHWCAKETVYKILDEENAHMLQDFIVTPFVRADQGVFFVQEHTTRQQITFKIHYRLFEDFALTYCVHQANHISETK